MPKQSVAPKEHGTKQEKINRMGQKDAEGQYYEKGRAQAKHGSSTANPTSLTDRPSETEQAAAQRGYEDQKQA